MSASVLLRLPPHSTESEQSILGGLLLMNAAWERVADIVCEADFYRDDHRRIFRHIAKLIDAGQPADVLTVFESLKKSNETEQAGGLAYLGEIANNTPSAANIRRYAEIVHERAVLREVAVIGDEIATVAMSPAGRDAEQILEQATGRLLALAESGSAKGEPQPVREILGRVVEAIQERCERGGAISGLPTGFADLDRLLDGLKAGDLIIVAGRPSMGKTTIVINIAEQVAMAGTPALVFSMEMSDTQLVMRSLASIGGLNLRALASGELADNEWSRVTYAMGQLHDAPLIIDQTANLTVGQMRARARRQKHKGGLGLVVIDYLQLMSAEGNNRNEELGAITRGLKLMARDLECPVICLSQLSRKCEERADKRPMLSDLRESGSIEQDADVVVMMYRDDYYQKDSPYKGLAEALVRKNRMGECGDVSLVFQGEHSRFRDADHGAIADANRAAHDARQQPKKRGPIGRGDL